VPVYDAGCSNVSGAQTIVGFTSITITSVTCTPTPRFRFTVPCRTISTGQPGGSYYGTLLSTCADCDPTEYCDGFSAACPADIRSPAGAPCDADDELCTADVCDAAGACTHDAGNAGLLCRSSNGPCDAAEHCSGSSVSCPEDSLAGETTLCREAVGACDAAEYCSGTALDCPGDQLAAAGAVCREAVFSCDVEETCDGSAIECPADGYAPQGTPCRTAAGACDIGESCSGTAASCPADLFLQAATTCRPSTGECDSAESCAGNSATCPPDAFRPDGQNCDDGNSSTVDDSCADGLCVGTLLCDDDNPCTRDFAEPATGECSFRTMPSPGCKLAGNTALQVKLRAKGQLRWKWQAGEETFCDEIGDPGVETRYDLCVYDNVAPEDSVLATHLRLEPDSRWAASSESCRWTFRDTSALNDGLASAVISPGAPRRC
jgi:hypothetical protein